jgi:hypothetical protein
MSVATISAPSVPGTIAGPSAAPRPAAPAARLTATPLVPPFPVYQFTVQKYHEMIEKGMLTEDDPVELLEGWMATKMGRNPPHDAAIALTDKRIQSLLPSGWHTRGQSGITTDDSEPEPDIAVVKGDVRAFVTRHPGPTDIGLLIESAEPSLQTDRVDKGRIYARAAISVYWIINLVDRQVEVYSDPDPRANPPAYRRRETYLPGHSVPVVLQGQPIGQIPVQDLLP